MGYDPQHLRLLASLASRPPAEGCQIAELRQRSSHWIMREAIAQYVEREERREAFRQNTLKAWEEYRETGLHATAAEVDGWLAGWGGEEELPAPECHS